MLQGIYKITNKKNGKIYIGSAINLARRWTEHISTLLEHSHHNDEMLSDFIEYGEDINIFQFEILEICQCSKSSLLSKETKYIIKYEALGEKGYNKSYPKKPKRNKLEKKKIICEMDNYENFLQNLDKELLLKIKNNIKIYGLEDQTKFKNKKYSYIYKSTFLSQNSLYNDEELQKLIKMACSNFQRNCCIKNIGSKEIFWTTYGRCKEAVEHDGFKKSYLTLNSFTPSKERRRYGMYVANPFINTWGLEDRPTKENRDLYKISKVIEWIANNLNIEEEFYLFLPCPYVRTLVEKYLNNLE